MKWRGEIFRLCGSRPRFGLCRCCERRQNRAQTNWGRSSAFVQPQLPAVLLGEAENAADGLSVTMGLNGEVAVPLVHEMDMQASGLIVGSSLERAPESHAQSPIGSATAQGDAEPVNAISREIVSPGDLIRAIRDSEIAVKAVERRRNAAASGGKSDMVVRRGGRCSRSARSGAADHCHRLS